MRNLRRALSLALASVMTLGMMVMGSSAASSKTFTDAASIKNETAVAVTSALGIFDGYDTGDFKPANVVTRAEMAVIISKILYGADVNAGNYAGVQQFTDVPEWAEGYVNLVASLGIVAGRGDGIFDPSATVTTAEASLMLTKALGYFKDEADYGDNWQLAAINQATTSNVLDGLKLNATEGLTRDNVAQMTFNTISKASTVEYNSRQGVYYTTGDQWTGSTTFHYAETLGYKNFDLVYRDEEKNEETDYGRPAVTWGTGSATFKKDPDDNRRYVIDESKLLATDEIITVADEADYTYTGAVKSKALYSLLGDAVCNDYTWKVWMDGSMIQKYVGPSYNEKGQQTQAGYSDGSITLNKGTDWTNKSDKPADDDQKYYTPISGTAGDFDFGWSKAGITTEFYIDKSNTTVTVVYIPQYIAQISAVRSDDDGRYVNIRMLSNTSPSLDENKFYTDKFSKDDYVYVTVDEDEDDGTVVATVDAVNTVSGTVTAIAGAVKDTGSITVDGTKYSYSKNVYGSSNNGWKNSAGDLDATNGGERDSVDLNEAYNVYLDGNNYVLAIEAQDINSKQYLYVQGVDYSLGDITAKVILSDGTKATIEIDDEYYDGDAVGTKQPTQALIESEILYKVFKYSKSSSDVYTLKKTTDYASNKLNVATYDKTLDVNINRDDASIEYNYTYTYGDASSGVNSTGSISADKTTVYIDVKSNTTYVGYENIPDFQDVDMIAAKNNEGVAAVVYIFRYDESKQVDDDNAIYFYVAKPKNYSKVKIDGADYSVRDVIIDGGSVTQLTIKQSGTADGVIYNDNKTGHNEGLYKADEFDGDYVTHVVYIGEKYADTVEAVGNGSFDNDQVQAANEGANDTAKGGVWSFNNDTVFVVVNDERDKAVEGSKSDLEKYDPANLETGDEYYVVQVVKANKSTAQLVYLYTYLYGQVSIDSSADGISKIEVSYEGDNEKTVNVADGDATQVADDDHNGEFTVKVTLKDIGDTKAETLIPTLSVVVDRDDDAAVIKVSDSTAKTITYTVTGAGAYNEISATAETGRNTVSFKDVDDDHYTIDSDPVVNADNKTVTVKITVEDGYTANIALDDVEFTTGALAKLTGTQTVTVPISADKQTISAVATAKA